jgi:hypothetical protein
MFAHADILNTILDMIKVESGKLQLEEVQFNTTLVLEESTDLANIPDMNRHRDGLRPNDFCIFQCDVVVGDFKRFKKILDNFLINDINFMIKAMLFSEHGPTPPSLGLSMIRTPLRFSNTYYLFSFGIPTPV